MSPVVIRPVTLADIPAVRVALIETWHATYDGIYGPDKVRDITARWHSLLALAKQVDEPRAVFLLAECNTAIVASAFASEAEPGHVHVYRLYVRPGAQGRGIGHDLMAATLAAFPNAQRFRLEVEPRNLPALQFYRRAGFVQVGSVSDCGGDSGVAALVLEWVRSA
jgi:ribosomal protein S18 acetylase RimI-like enzyme